MKKIKFLVNVKDKNTGELYKTNDIKEFEDSRADEILNKKRANGKHYAELFTEVAEPEKVIEEVTEVLEKEKTIEEVDEVPEEKVIEEVEIATKNIEAETAVKKPAKKNK